MRQTEFRSKRIDGGCWVYGDRLHIGFRDSKNPVAYIMENKILSGEVHSVTPNSVGQRIGLFGSDGLGIWEGDIITINHFKFDNTIIDIEHIGIIEYSDDLAAFVLDRILPKVRGGNCGYKGRHIEPLSAFAPLDKAVIKVVGNMTDCPWIYSEIK